MSRPAASLAAAQPEGCIPGHCALPGETRWLGARASVRSARGLGPRTMGRQGPGSQAWGGARQGAEMTGVRTCRRGSSARVWAAAHCRGERPRPRPRVRGEVGPRDNGAGVGGWEGFPAWGRGYDNGMTTAGTC